MIEDYFDFWLKVSPDAKIHPADQAVFNRLQKSHYFDLNCLPLNFAGPLKKARVVLLFLSPELGDNDSVFAATPEGQAQVHEQRNGLTDLPGDSSALGHAWRESRLKFLGDWQSHRDKIATMNIGAYHSRSFTDHDVLASLPSSRAALEWAQSILFPEAEAGNRVVICLRAAHYWGLKAGEIFGESLFAPNVTRGGHMIKDEIREKATEAARVILAL